MREMKRRKYDDKNAPATEAMILVARAFFLFFWSWSGPSTATSTHTNLEKVKETVSRKSTIQFLG
jgi:hypothetical protein